MKDQTQNNEPLQNPANCVPGNCQEFDCKPGDLCDWLYAMAKVQNLVIYLREKEVTQNV